jgi:hypothetical protein
MADIFQDYPQVFHYVVISRCYGRRSNVIPHAVILTPWIKYMSTNSEALLRAILSMTGRVAIPPPELMQIVAPKGGGEAQLAAYNLCDGSKSQGEIAKELKIDPGSFSRTVSRWIEAGVVIRLGEPPNIKLLHIYPLTKEHGREGR